MTDIRRKADRRFVLPEWRVLSKADTRDTDAECLELVVSRRPPRIGSNGSFTILPAETGKSPVSNIAVIP